MRATRRRSRLWVPAAAVLFSVPCRAQFPDVAPPPPCARGAGTVTKTLPAADRIIAAALAPTVYRDSAELQLASGLTQGAGERLRQVGGIVASYNPSRGWLEIATAVGRPPEYVLGTNLTHGDLETTITVQLLGASDGRSVWRQRYVRQRGGLLAIEGLIARAAATAILGKLPEKSAAALGTPVTRDPAAYEHYLRGNYFLALDNAADIARALPEYEAAVRADPGFAEAYARIGLADAALLDLGWSGASRTALLARGEGAAAMSLKTDPKSSHGWLARGALLEFRNPRALGGASDAYDRAIALDPGNADAYHRAALLLQRLGKTDAAAAMFRRARALAPTDAGLLIDLAEVSVQGRRYYEACGLLNAALESNRRAAYAYALRAIVRLRLGETRYAWSDAETAGKVGNPMWGEAAAAVVDAWTRDTASAHARIRALVPATAKGPLSASDARFLALALIAAGEQRRALDVLERAQPPGARLWLVLQDPGFERLRSNPRFQRLVQRSRAQGA